MSDEAKITELEKANQRMKKVRAEKTPVEEIENDKREAKERMTELRAARTEEDVGDENEVAKSKMRECRSWKSAEEKEYIMIEKSTR